MNNWQEWVCYTCPTNPLMNLRLVSALPVGDAEDEELKNQFASAKPYRQWIESVRVKLDDVPATPAATLSRAHRIALDAGLHYVYTGNVHDRDGDTTHCPGCGASVIERDWYEILNYSLSEEGKCKHCGAAIAGRFGRFEKPFGARRIPVRLHATV